MEKIETEIERYLATVDNSIHIQELNLTPIQEFYKDSNVFVTGCTGFIGQVLLEKLLRSCPVSKIFLLVRKKKGAGIETRLDDMFKDPVFQRIRNQFPDVREKIVLIEGDSLIPGFGLSDENIKLLIEEVDIIFHVAATVRFDEKLRKAVFINIRATRDLLRLAHQMPRLKSFMHVSTVYSNCIHKVVKEEIYPPAANYNGLISMVDCMSEDNMAKITSSLIGKYPNTYTYTKQIAEGVIAEEGKGLPIAILRPAIVISTYKEPIRGWINNLYGPTGFLVGVGMGLIRVGYGASMSDANIVPVDMCVNSLVAAAWEVGSTFSGAKTENIKYTIPVYTFESTNDMEMNWKQFMDTVCGIGLLIPSSKTVWYYSFHLINSYPVYLAARFLVHTVPAAIVDGVLLCKGKPAQIMKLYEKIHKFSGVLADFTKHTWIMHSKNTRKLIEKMTERDKKIFFSDLKQWNWDEYSKAYAGGVRLYLLKEPTDTIPKARKRFKRLYWLHQGIKSVIGILLVWVVWTILKFVFNL